MGIVTIFVAPIAAFVEPDEEELFGTKDKPPAVSKGARIRILSAGVISNFIVAAVAMALFFGPVIGSITPVDRTIVVDVQDGSAAQMAGIEEGMALVAASGKEVGSLEEFYSNIASGTMQIKVIHNDLEESLQLSRRAGARHHGWPLYSRTLLHLLQDFQPEASSQKLMELRSAISKASGTKNNNSSWPNRNQ